MHQSQDSKNCAYMSSVSWCPSMMQGLWTYWWNPWLVGAGKERGETERGDVARCLERSTFLGGRECSQQLRDRPRRGQARRSNCLLMPYPLLENAMHINVWGCRLESVFSLESVSTTGDIGSRCICLTWSYFLTHPVITQMETLLSYDRRA